MHKLDVKNSKNLMNLGAIAYFTSYLTRNNFAAVLAAIIQAGDIDKPSAGLVTTLGFITYGIGQLISGWLGDRINPKKLMFAGFLMTASMNFLIPICPNGKVMCVVWAFNGFAQSFMWPPMVKIMKTAMDADFYNRGCIRVNAGGTAATIAIYLVSPLIIKLWSWRGVFIINATVAIFVSALWITRMTAIEKTADIEYALRTSKNGGGEKKKSKLSVGVLLLVFVLTAIILQGCLRDGVTTWIPTYITEVFHLDSSISILSGVFIPLFSLLSYKVANAIYNKMGKKPYHCAGLLFAVATVCTVVLRIFPDASAIVTVILAALIVGTMHGINLIIVCYLPGILANDDNMSFISGLFNFMTYVGSAVSTYGFAVISDTKGWSAAVTSWVIISGMGIVMCMLSGMKDKKKIA